MSVTIYDKALLTKFERWIKDNKIKILGVNESTRLFKYRLDIENDKPIELPLISLNRNSPVIITDTSKRPLTFEGFKVEGNKEKTNQLNAIPISISYQLDIYTRYIEEAEEYIRNFIFNLINYPRLDIEIPYKDCKIISNSYITIDNNIEDNSDVSERIISDQFTRKTITFTLKDAYLYDYKTTDNWKIDANIKLIASLDEVEFATIESIDVK